MDDPTPDDFDDLLSSLPVDLAVALYRMAGASRRLAELSSSRPGSAPSLMALGDLRDAADDAMAVLALPDYAALPGYEGAMASCRTARTEAAEQIRDELQAEERCPS